MSQNPLNLLVRFLLELFALGAIFYWGWTTHSGIGQIVWGIGLTLVAAVLWGTFRVPDDPGKAPVATPGPLRLLLEIVILGGPVLLLIVAGQQTVAAVYGTVLLVHYLVSYDRVRWLLIGGTNPTEKARKRWT